MPTFNSNIDRLEATPLMPEEASSVVIKNATAMSVIMRMAQRLTNMSRGQLRLPILSSLPIAYIATGASQIVRDTVLKQTTEMTWANKYVYAEPIHCIVPVPDNVLADSAFDIWGELQEPIAGAIGKVFDQAVLYGTNAPTDTWPTAIVPGADAASHSVVIGSVGADLYDDLMGEGGSISKIEDDGFAHTGHIGALTMRAKLRGVRDADGNLIFTPSMQEGSPYSLDGSPIDFPTNGAIDATESLVITGDWTQLVFSVRQDITLKLLDQAVITDSSGNVILNLAQQDMTALRVTFRAGWQLPNPVNQINATEATRYPFSTLIPA